jgi:S-adenosylmethionine decarboxylase proenzyme
MQGLHLTGDLFDCDCPPRRLVDVAALRAHCLTVVRDAGLTPVADLFHPFPGSAGVTGVVLLAESHMAVHTWPETMGVTLDIYVCNFGADNSAKAHALRAAMTEFFAPTKQRLQELRRGVAP